MRKLPKSNMLIPKCTLILLIIFLKYSNQVAIKNEISEITDNSSDDHNNAISKSVSNVKQSLSTCIQKPSNEVVRCILKHSILSMSSAIDDNDTWHITDYLSMIKNTEWKPVENQAREHKSVFSVFLDKLSDLLESRSVQFKIPQKNREAKQYASSSVEMGK